MNLYVLLGILAAFGFIAWRLYRAGAKNKAISIERDSLEETLGVEHAIRDELIEEKRLNKGRSKWLSLRLTLPIKPWAGWARN